tara:strand:+ start:97 stop:483 length:387 start_codon:yes stop_codon:yes gene_type:complete
LNVFTLLERASLRLQQGDALFHEQADTILGILRSSRVVPFKRSSLNGSLHRQVAGLIVQAYDEKTSIDVVIRRAGTWHHFGFSTKVVSYLDKMVQNELLVSQTGKAKGALVLGDLLDTYLTEAHLTLT